jgi:hypothetical protein
VKTWDAQTQREVDDLRSENTRLRLREQVAQLEGRIAVLEEQAEDAWERGMGEDL